MSTLSRRLLSWLLAILSLIALDPRRGASAQPTDPPGVVAPDATEPDAEPVESGSEPAEPAADTRGPVDSGEDPADPEADPPDPANPSVDPTEVGAEPIKPARSDTDPTTSGDAPIEPADAASEDPPPQPPGQPLDFEPWDPNDPVVPYDPNGPVADPTPREKPVLSLEQAREVMLENSFDLALNQTQIQQAALLEQQAFSIWIPTVNLTARYTLRDEEVSLDFPNALAPLSPYLDSTYNNDPTLQQFFVDNPEVPDARLLASQPGGGGTVQFRHNYQLTGTVSQTLFNARAFPLKRLAELSMTRSQFAQEEIEYQLQGTLTRLYFNAVTFQGLINVSRRNVELARISYEKSLVAYEEQIGNQFELGRAKLAVSRAERDLRNARLSCDLSVQSLATFLNTQPTFDVQPPPRLPIPDSPEPLVESALEERPELTGLDIDHAIALERIDENDATYWPVLSAQLQGTFQRAAAFSGNPFFWTLTVQASWTIYDGGLRDTETRTRELEAARIDIQRRQRRVQIAGQLREAWIQVLNQRSSLEIARAEAELARQNHELIRDANELGAASALEVELAQEQRFLSELAEANAALALQAQLYQMQWLSAQE